MGRLVGGGGGTSVDFLAPSTVASGAAVGCAGGEALTGRLAAQPSESQLTRVAAVRRRDRERVTIGAAVDLWGCARQHAIPACAWLPRVYRRLREETARCAFQFPARPLLPHTCGVGSILRPGGGPFLRICP